MKTEVIHSGNKNAKRRAVEVLKAGGLVAFPTDTVYGLGVSPWNLDAVARLYEAKSRPLDIAIPLLLSDASQLSRVAIIPSRFEHEFKQLVKRFWPGGLTLVLPKAAIVPDAVSRGATVAVRVPDLELTRHVIRDAGGVLATTSANISGQPSPVTVQEVEDQLGDRIDLILDGGLSRGGVPSSILDCTVLPPMLLRRGTISVTDLQSIVGPIKVPHLHNK
jgi:L-threonylcarbamoyladenylate synthase